MIGIDQEPSSEAQADLVRLFGDGKYALRFAEQGGGTVVASITRYGEQAPAMLVHFATNATRPQVDAVWSEALQRYRKDHAHELAQAAPAGRPGDAVEDRGSVQEPSEPAAPPSPTPSTGPAGPSPTPTEPSPSEQHPPTPNGSRPDEPQPPRP